jgi:hypothetical protein
MFLYYSIGDIFYSTIPVDIQGTLPLLMVVYVIVPLILVLGLVRLWLLKPVSQRLRILDISYFVLPVLIIIACLAAQIWVGIILSMLAGIIILYEFIGGIIKKDFLLLDKE